METIDEIIKTAAHITRTISVVLNNSSKGNHEVRLLYVVWLCTSESDVQICLLNVPNLIESAEWKAGHERTLSRLFE
jgi:hypothetical protein